MDVNRELNLVSQFKRRIENLILKENEINDNLTQLYGIIENDQ